MKKDYLKIKDAAELLDVSEWTVRKWIRLGMLKHYRFGGAIRIYIEDLFSFAEECCPCQQIEFPQK